MARSTWGHIEKRGKDVWRIRYTDSDGAKRSETVRGSRKDAERRKAELQVETEGKATGSMTLESFWKTIYLPECEERLASTTLSGYKRVWRTDISPAFAGTKLCDLASADVQEWLSGMTGGRARGARAVLRAMVTRAYSLDLVDRNVMSKRYVMPKRMTGHARTKDVFTAEELDRVFYECRGEWWEGAFILAGFGSAQREEAMSPKLDEIEFRRTAAGLFAIVPVLRTVVYVDGEIIVQNRTKTEFRARFLIVPPPYSERLEAIKRERSDAGDVWLTDDGFGNPANPNNMATAYKRWFLGRTLRYVPFSNLRNSYSTMMHAKGIDAAMMPKIMGHSQMRTDAAFYNRPGADELIEVVARAMDNKNNPIV